MDDFEKLRETIETNFRISALYTRQVGERLNHRMDGLSHRMDGLSHRMDELAQGMRDVGQEMKTFGSEIRTDFEGLAERQEASIADLKQRVKDLEDRAS